VAQEVAITLREGDLISAVGSDDPDIYIINEFGYKRLFLNPEIFEFYGHLGGFTNVNRVTAELRDAYVTSGYFRNCEADDENVYGISVEGEDTGELHLVNVSGEDAAREDPAFFRKVFCINNKEFEWYPKGKEYISLSEVPDYERESARREEVALTRDKVIVCDRGMSVPVTQFLALRTYLSRGAVLGACEGDEVEVVVDLGERSSISDALMNDELTGPASVSEADVIALAPNGNGTAEEVFIPLLQGGIGRVIDNALWNPRDIIIRDGYVYVAAFVLGEDSSIFAVVDVNDPVNPAVVGTVTDGISTVQDVALAGDYAYLTSEGNDRMVIIDISDPRNPFIAGNGFESSIDVPRGITVEGGYAYLVNDGPDSLIVFDISDPSQPASVSVLPDSTLGQLRSPVVSGDYLYVADPEGGAIGVIDITNKQSPQWAALLTDPLIERPEDIEIVGSNIYISDSKTNRFIIAELNGPTAWSVRGSVSGLDAIQHQVRGSRAFVMSSPAAGSDERYGVAVINIADPSNPLVESTIDTELLLRQVVADDSYLYLAGGRRLTVYEMP
jgi:hypothetical protein